MRNKLYKISTATLVLALTFALSCSDDKEDGGDGSSSSVTNGGGRSSSSGGNSSSGLAGASGTFPDSRDGKSYKWVEIGTQTWMAENLTYNAPGSKCYGDDPANCTKYGRLYDWATAMGIDAKYNKQEWGGSDVKHKGICPTGWHIPSDADWNVLMKFIDPSCSDSRDCRSAGTKLKAKSDWNTGSGYIPSTDDYGFAALPGGGYLDGIFVYAGDIGVWLSATESNADAYGVDVCYRRSMFYDDTEVDHGGMTKDGFISVRCLKD